MAYTIEGRDIVLNGFENGISSNPYEGIADMRNIDSVSIPGEASVAMSTSVMTTQAAISSVTFTVDPGTDVFTYNGTVPLEINTCVVFTNSGGALPAGLSTHTPYYVLTTPTSTTFTVSAVSAYGTTLNITDAGSGTNTFSTINMGTPLYFANYLYTSYYRFYFLQDSNGRVWFYYPTDGLLAGTGKWVYTHNQSTENPTFLKNPAGLVAYKGFLFEFTTNTINAISIIDHSVTSVTIENLTKDNSWNRGWKDISGDYTGIQHQAIVGSDNAVYFCNDKAVGYIRQIAGSLVPDYGEAFSIAETATIATGATTSGSSTITTGSSFFVKSMVGAVIVGTGIPTGSTIASVTNGTTAVLELNTASSTGTGITFTITKSYDFSTEGLTLNSNDSATCLTELGNLILVGGRNNNIYSWDRLLNRYDLIFVSENFISRMVTVNTTTYIFAGYNGRIYITNGSNASFFWEIPDHLSNTVNPYYIWRDACFNRNQLYFGFQAMTNSGTTINQYGGLWSIDLNANGGRLSNKLSYNTYSGYASAMAPYRQNYITNPTNDGYGLFIGWYDGSKGGVDKTQSAPYSNSDAYIDFDMIPVGQFLTKRTFENVEYKLTSPLVAGELVALYYRLNITDSFTEIPITQGGETGDISGIGSVNFENAQWVQIRVVSDSTASSPSYVRLKEVRIR